MCYSSLCIGPLEYWGEPYYSSIFVSFLWWIAWLVLISFLKYDWSHHHLSNNVIACQLYFTLVGYFVYSLNFFFWIIKYVEINICVIVLRHWTNLYVFQRRFGGCSIRPMYKVCFAFICCVPVVWICVCACKQNFTPLSHLEHLCYAHNHKPFWTLEPESI